MGNLSFLVFAPPQLHFQAEQWLHSPEAGAPRAQPQGQEQLPRGKVSHPRSISATCAICVEHSPGNLSATAVQMRGSAKVTLKGIWGHGEDVQP